ncbi:MAG: hypothetical protein ACOYIQ_04320 [Christensenellales bacterium]|jgi:hypothetical protein
MKDMQYKKLKVDYSRYYLKNYFAYGNTRFCEEETDKEEDADGGMNGDAEKELKKEKANPDGGRRGREARKNGVFVTVIILLCFLITAASADLLTDNYLSRELFAFQRAGIRVSYYALVGKAHKSREEALPEAILARQGGGASYILEEGGQFFVIYNVYLDKSAAQAVQKKNRSTSVMQLDIKKADGDLEPPLTEKLEELAGLCESAIASLYNIAVAVEKKELNYFDAQIKLGELKSPLITYKQNLYNDSDFTRDKEFVLLQLEIIIGSIDAALAANPSTFTFLSDIRYIQMNIIRVYQNLFKYYPSK